MKKLTSLVIACIFVLSCLTSCSEADNSSNTVTSTTTTTVVTTTTTTTVPDSVPESTTTESMKETTTITESSVTESETTTTTKPTTTTTESSRKGTTTKATKAETTTTTKKTPEPTGNRVVLDVKNIQMLPELPSGSEITCAAMVLNYFGFNVSKMDLIKYLTIDEAPDADGTWGHPDDVFVGHPTKKGYGCNEPVLEKSVNDYFASNNISNYETTFRVVRKNAIIEEIKKGNPVIIWITQGLAEPSPGDSWMLNNGNSYTWIKGRYCVVIIGYDLDTNKFVVSDPLDSRGTVEYDMDNLKDANFKINGGTLTIRKKS